jgi:hypothetical protein
MYRVLGANYIKGNYNDKYRYNKEITIYMLEISTGLTYRFFLWNEFRKFSPTHSHYVSQEAYLDSDNKMQYGCIKREIVSSIGYINYIPIYELIVQERILTKRAKSEGRCIFDLVNYSNVNLFTVKEGFTNEEDSDGYVEFSLFLFESNVKKEYFSFCIAVLCSKDKKLISSIFGNRDISLKILEYYT